MYQEVLPGFFRIMVPLPGNPLKELNAWLVKGKKRHLLVDNGFNMLASEEALKASLAALEVEADALDFFITHLHSDHNGLTHKLAAPGSTIYSGKIDGEKINNFITQPELWKQSMSNLAKHGFPQPELDELLKNHPGKIYANNQPLNFTYIEDGERLEYGNYVFKVVATPGHTPGHQLLHEERGNFLISGDHILGSITPNITCWDGVADSLGDYLSSLDKTDALGAVKSCPGHRAIVENTHARIEELRAHHKKRLAEAFGIVGKLKNACAWDVASRMSWNLRGSWPEYHAAQKCFAVGEAVAHLDHLSALGEIAKVETGDGKILYMDKTL